ncbi:MAG: glycosyltransferase [Chloroflexota bacterium]|nr:glycosyltransferase [Chloroflexota bacterium]MBI5702104.1 glycosyltransferase [Chloroflexota bacterium]
MKELSLITLSIVSHGDAERITRLLASIQAHEPDTRARFHVILTDNLKDDLPDFDPAPWASLKILRNERQLGFAENHNRAFEQARSEYFSILNPDLVLERPIFERLLGSLQTHQADLIAPQIVDETGTVQDSYRPLPTPFELIRRRLPGYTFKPYLPDSNGMIRPDWIAGMFWLMRSETYRQLGGMDRRFRLYLEDVDFCSRARLQGMKLLVDTQVQVRHDARRASRRSPYFLFLHLQSALRFFSSPVYRQIRKI